MKGPRGCPGPLPFSTLPYCSLSCSDPRTPEVLPRQTELAPPSSSPPSSSSCSPGRPELFACLLSLSLSLTPHGPPYSQSLTRPPGCSPCPQALPALQTAHCPSRRPDQAPLASSNLFLAPQHLQEQIQAPWGVWGRVFKALSEPAQPHSPIPAWPQTFSPPATTTHPLISMPVPGLTT